MFVQEEVVEVKRVMVQQQSADISKYLKNEPANDASEKAHCSVDYTQQNLCDEDEGDEG